MSEYDYKEVYFHEYCDKCEYGSEPESNDICDDCLAEYMNEHSHKPVNFKEKESN